MINRWIGIGNLTADPICKVTQSGKSVVSFCVAVQRPSKTKTTDFLNCVAWNQTAELLAKYCRKGSRIAVEGTLTSRNYEDKNGNNRVAIEVVVGSITFLETKKDSVNVPEAVVAEPNDYELTTDDLPF